MKNYNSFTKTVLGLLLLSIFFTQLINPVQAQRKKKNASNESTLSYDEKLYGNMEYRLVGPFRGGRSCAVTGVPGQPNLSIY